MNPSRIVFYDGTCALCNGVVRWLLRLDRLRTLHYAPLQGETAKQLLGSLPDELDALVYWREGNLAVHSSDAIGNILRDLPWPWKALSLILWIPRPLRDWAYRQVAARRYPLFGRYESCPLPAPELRPFFLP